MLAYDREVIRAIQCAFWSPRLGPHGSPEDTVIASEKTRCKFFFFRVLRLR